MHSDKKLARRISQGDAQAFAELVDTYGTQIQRLARQYTRTQTDAEDLVQEVFVDLYRCSGSFQGASSLATWVYRVALNHCLKHQERRKPAGVSYDEAMLQARADDASNPASCAAGRELGDQIRSALARLTTEHRDVVILHEMQELTYRECAEILQIPIGTVKSRLSNAFRRLRSSLSGYVLEDGLHSKAIHPISETPL